MTVFLVAHMSISRLVLLIFPQHILSRYLSWLCPLLYLFFNTTLKMILFFAGKAQYMFLQRVGMCKPLAPLSTEDNDPILANEWRWEIILRISFCIQAGMTVLPISLSFLATLFLLWRHNRNVDRLSVKHSSNSAIVTVILLTLIYIIVNIPNFVYQIKLIKMVVEVQPGTNTKEEIPEIAAEIFNTRLEYSYLWILTYTFSTSLNSAANPLVYFYRIKSFRRFSSGVFSLSSLSRKGMIESKTESKRSNKTESNF